MSNLWTVVRWASRQRCWYFNALSHKTNTVSLTKTCLPNHRMGPSLGVQQEIPFCTAFKANGAGDGKTCPVRWGFTASCGNQFRRTYVRCGLHVQQAVDGFPGPAWPYPAWSDSLQRVWSSAMLERHRGWVWFGVWQPGHGLLGSNLHQLKSKVRCLIN